MDRSDCKESTLCILPARWGSKRFPGKPIHPILGKPMIIHVYDRVKSLFPHVYIATDDDRIQQIATQYRADCIRTLQPHDSGTSRCFEAFYHLPQAIRENSKYLINVQGDEPLIDPFELEKLVLFLDQGEVDIATLARPVISDEEYINPNRVKVVRSQNGKAINFSRSPIPHSQSGRSTHTFIHIGVYGFRISAIPKIAQLPRGSLEVKENLEQLRWLEHEIPIQCLETHYHGIGVDSPSDIELVEALLNDLK